MFGSWQRGSTDCRAAWTDCRPGLTGCRLESIDSMSGRAGWWTRLRRRSKVEIPGKPSPGGRRPPSEVLPQSRRLGRAADDGRVDGLCRCRVRRGGCLGNYESNPSLSVRRRVIDVGSEVRVPGDTGTYDRTHARSGRCDSVCDSGIRLGSGRDRRCVHRVGDL